MNNTISVTPTTEENFARALNIDAHREMEIDEILETCYQLTDTYTDALAAASHKLHSVNELAYASFHLGAYAESQRTKYELMHRLMGA
jgi:hypothetical protein